MEAIERLYKERPDLYVSAVVRLIPVQHQLEVADHRSAIEYSTQELLGMVNGEVIEHQPTKRITRQTEVASASVAEDTGPVDGDGS